MKLQNRRRSAFNVTTYKRSIRRLPIRVNEFNYWTNAWLVIVIYHLCIFFLREAGVQSSSGQSSVTTTGGNEE